MDVTPNIIFVSSPIVKVLQAAARDDHSNTVYSQLKVFILAGCVYIQAFWHISVAPSVQSKGILKAETMSWQLDQQLGWGSRKLSSLIEAKWLTGGGGLHK